VCGNISSTRPTVVDHAVSQAQRKAQ